MDCFAAVCVVQLAVLGFFGWRWYNITVDGIPYQWQCVPRLEISWFGTDYIRVVFPEDTTQWLDETPPNVDETVYVHISRDEKGVMKIEGASASKPLIGGDYMEAQVISYDAGTVQFQVPFDRYRIAPDKADGIYNIEPDDSVIASIRMKRGLGVIEGIYVNGISLESSSNGAAMEEARAAREKERMTRQTANVSWNPVWSRLRKNDAEGNRRRENMKSFIKIGATLVLAVSFLMLSGFRAQTIIHDDGSETQDVLKVSQSLDEQKKLRADADEFQKRNFTIMDYSNSNGEGFRAMRTITKEGANKSSVDRIVHKTHDGLFCSTYYIDYDYTANSVSDLRLGMSIEENGADLEYIISFPSGADVKSNATKSDEQGSTYMWSLSNDKPQKISLQATVWHKLMIYGALLVIVAILLPSSSWNSAVAI